jgi:hypothetical protein
LFIIYFGDIRDSANLDIYSLALFSFRADIGDKNLLIGIAKGDAGGVSRRDLIVGLQTKLFFLRKILDICVYKF